MKKTKRNILYALAVIIIGIFAFLLYLGAFKTITLKTKELGPYYLAYQKYKGDYTKMSNSVENVKNILKNKYKINCPTSFGIYYDNPQKIDTDKLRSDIGCIINKKDIDKIKNLPKIKILNKRTFVFTSFPYKNALSFWLGLIKVYSAFETKIEQHPNLPYMMEIYDIENGEILYMMPI